MPLKHLPALLVCASMVLLLVMGDTAADAVSASLELCVTRVIPPLFPYMVLSSVILSLDLLRPLYRFIPTEKWFGMPRCAAPVLLTGFICGFPVGASGAARLVRDKKLSPENAAKLCAVSSAASPAFVIGTVGQWWTKEYGIILWLTQVLTSLLLAVTVFRSDCPSGSIAADDKPPAQSATECLCDAVSSAARSCLNVTAYITFFGTAAVLLSALLPPLAPLFSAALEFSRGASFGARIGGLYGIILTGAAVGFSGISVLMQTASFLIPAGVSVRPTVCAHLAVMSVSAAVSALYYLFRLPASSPVPASGSIFSPSAGFFVISALGMLIFFGNRGSESKKHTEKHKSMRKSRCKKAEFRLPY